MAFIRQNLFVIVVALVVLVVGGIMLAMNAGVTDDIETRIEERKGLSDRLQRVVRGELVNEEVVEARRTFVEQIRDSRNAVRDVSVSWNERNYEPLALPVADRAVPAFPIQPDLYKQYGLQLTFTERYIERVRELLASMKPTGPPGEQEIAAETRALEALYRAKREREERERGEDAEDGERPPDVDAVPPGEYPGPYGGEMPAGGAPWMTGGAAGRRPGATAQQKIAREALVNVMVRKASDGQIYAAENSFDRVFEIPDANAPYDLLWSAMVNLWVSEDIVAAINRTNQQAFGGTGAEVKSPTVINAAVKRLVTIEIEEDYYVSGAPVDPQAPRRTTPTPSPNEGAPPGGQPGYGDYGGDYGGGYGGYGGPGGFDPYGSGAGRGTGIRAVEGAVSLTRRTTSPQYEVVRYSFQVIMPARYLKALQDNLMERNYHTVLKTEMEAVGPTFGSDRERTTDGYYYGPDPVMQVTVYGELLLLTEWERGVWDEETGQWSAEHPPLIPVEALAALARRVPDAMRSEDRRRVEQSGRITPATGN